MEKEYRSIQMWRIIESKTLTIIKDSSTCSNVSTVLELPSPLMLPSNFRVYNSVVARDIVVASTVVIPISLLVATKKFNKTKKRTIRKCCFLLTLSCCLLVAFLIVCHSGWTCCNGVYEKTSL